MRTPRLFLGIFALALLLPLLLACGGPDEPADGPYSEPTAAKEEEIFRIFEQGGVSWVFERTRLINRFPTVNWERVTYLLYWSLRISPFGLFALLFVSIRIRKSRWPATDYPQGPAGLTMLPSDLPAPAVSVLVDRKVGPQTYLSILVDMLQKGNLTITGTSHKEGNYQSDVKLVRQFEPDQPWKRWSTTICPYPRLTPKSCSHSCMDNRGKRSVPIWTRSCSPGAYLTNPPCRSWQNRDRVIWLKSGGSWPQQSWPWAWASGSTSGCPGGPAPPSESR